MSWIEDFKQFALRGNLVDMAVAFTVGAAFGTIAKSLVQDVLMPPVGLLLGDADFSDLFLVLQEGATAPAPYATLVEAQAAGAVTVNYGAFGNNVLAFVLVALAMFAIIRAMNRLEDSLEARFAGPPPEPGDPSDKKCRFCRTTIPFRATRCPACTSHLDDEA